MKHIKHHKASFLQKLLQIIPFDDTITQNEVRTHLSFTDSTKEQKDMCSLDFDNEVVLTKDASNHTIW